MSATGTGASLFTLDSSFARDLEGLFVPWQATPAPHPSLLTLNDELARELGLDPDALRTDDGIAALIGAVPQPGSVPLAQAYAGHQFGGYSPRLGDGRAVLLGEIVDVHGRRRDLHLKGSGRTPFARGGDGKAVVGPMLREHLIGEAMHALGVPTTRALAVIATGETVMREAPLPGAVLVRVAASHLRVGTFQYAAANPDPTLLRRLADYAIARHHPAAADAPNRYLALYDSVVDAQASLIARWMLVGFVHGVMNTDNTTISGETIDYGPCAFIDAFDPATVFSSIDHAGRYAYGSQPVIAQWNLARLAEAMLGLFDDDTERAVGMATDVLGAFPERFQNHWTAGISAKLGLDGGDDNLALADALLALIKEHRVDHTAFFRALADSLRGDADGVRSMFDNPSAFDAWSAQWRDQLAMPARDPRQIADAMDRVNPVYIPRNHLVDEALAAATVGDLAPFERLLAVVADPFTARPGFERYASPPPAGFGPFVTYCGT